VMRRGKFTLRRLRETHSVSFPEHFTTSNSEEPLKMKNEGSTGAILFHGRDGVGGEGGT
jgi:hypothetical protein